MKNDEYISKALILSKCEELWNKADETTELGRGVINAIDEITDYVNSLSVINNKQLISAKKLLKIALEDMNTLYESGKDEGCLGIKFKWRYEDEVMKLLGDDINVSINEN